MKKTILILALILSTSVFSQLVNTPIDTVCSNSEELSIYTVQSIGSVTYNWIVPPCAKIISGQNTNSIQVKWLDCYDGLMSEAISVTYKNVNGCESPPVLLDVLVYKVTPTIEPLGVFCKSEPCVTLNGLPKGGTWLGVGVSDNSFCPASINSESNYVSNVKYTVTIGGCVFSTSTSVPIYGVPKLLPIQHN